MLSLLVYLLIALVIFAVIWWAIQQLGLPQPVRVVAVVVMAIVAVVLLLQLVGGMPALGHLR